MREGQKTRDEWLALRCQTSEPGAFEALIREMERPLLFYLLQSVRNQGAALELLQETWIRALKNFRKLKDPGAVRPWLYSLAHGVAVDHLRRDGARHRAEEQYSGTVGTSVDADLSGLTGSELREALACLSPEHRNVLVLHFLEDFAIGEIARILAVPAGTVKSRIHHAKAQMKQILLEGNDGTQS
jgi:RNA polymerase sigma-70 factor, ECF subfamily